jgi:O-antigen/teichoic acid export membrane protein
MSLAQRAFIASSFTYLRLAIGLVVGVVLVPFVLRRVGSHEYGLWIVMGELLAYAALVDCGLVSIMPWLVAEIDGRRDVGALKALVTHGVLLAAAAAGLYAVAAATLWSVAPTALSLSAEDCRALRGPFVVVVVATMAGYPLRIFTASLAGVQDVVWNGLVGIAQALASFGITIVLLVHGDGLYALAVGLAVPQLAALVADTVRASRIRPELFRNVPSPTWAGMSGVATVGLAAWIAALGVQLLAGANGTVVALVHQAAAVPIFVCTLKLGQILVQMCWIVPDSGLVGLARLHGEGRRERVQAVADTMLRLLLLFSGLAACVVLTVNRMFVTWWVGPQFFAGAPVTALIAAGIITSSFVHGLLCVPAVLGARLGVGGVTVVWGAVQVASALVLGTRWGFEGIAAAPVLSAAAIALPLGLRLLRSRTGLTARHVWTTIVSPWSKRFVLPGACATALMLAQDGGAEPFPVIGAAGVLVLYALSMRPLCRDLTGVAAVSRWLALRPFAVVQRVAALARLSS